MHNIDQMHAHDCYQNVTEPQATEYHKECTHVQHRNWLKHAAHKLVQHTLQVIWRWHGQIKAVPSFLACATGSPHCCSQKRSESSDRNCESGNAKTNCIDRLPCIALDIELVKPRVVSVLVVIINQGRLFMVHVFDCYQTRVLLELTQGTNVQNKSRE